MNFSLRKDWNIVIKLQLSLLSEWFSTQMHVVLCLTPCVSGNSLVCIWRVCLLNVDYQFQEQCNGISIFGLNEVNPTNICKLLYIIKWFIVNKMSRSTRVPDFYKKLPIRLIHLKLKFLFCFVPPPKKKICMDSHTKTLPIDFLYKITAYLTPFSRL